MKVTILGCGASVGVPIIGCNCAVCASTNPKNKRRRVSVLIQSGNTNIVIDTSPDLRAQIMDNPVRHLDGVLYTHDHSDHVQGIADLRPINAMMNSAINIYSDKSTLDTLQQSFPYVFRTPNLQYGWYHPSVNPIEIVPHSSFKVGELEVVPFTQIHGKRESLGFRIGTFAYSTDCNQLDEKAFATLKGVDCWVVDCQGYGKQYTHSSLPETLAWTQKVQPKRAILTHMSHEIDYETLKSNLPANIEPAYDNMVIDNL